MGLIENIIETFREFGQTPPEPDFLKANQRRTIKLQCPQCQDTGKDNLNITLEKGIAKCFSCGLAITQSLHFSSIKESVRLLKELPEDNPIRKMLETRKVYQAAVQSGTIGVLTKKIIEEFGLKIKGEGLVFYGGSGPVSFRPVSGKPKTMHLTESPIWKYAPNPDKPLAVFEGEMDALSLLAITNEFNICSTGGAHRIYFGPEKEIWVFPDNDAEGEKWLAAHLERFACHIVRMPAGIKDLNEALQKLSAEEIANLFKTAEYRARPLEAVIEEIAGILDKPKVPSRIKHRQVAKVVYEDLKQKGKFLDLWGNPYYFDNDRRIVLPMGEGLEWDALMGKYTLLKGEQVFSATTQYILTESINSGTQKITDAKVMSYFDPVQKALFIDLRDGRVLKLYGERKTEIQNNGDEVLFYRGRRDLGELTFEETDRDYLWEMLSLFTIQNEESKQLLYCWIMAIVFNGLFETKPLLFLESVAGSGKTTLAKTIGRILINENFNVSAMPESIDSFMAVLHKNAYIVFDNAERIDSNMLDHIAIAATGASFQKRKLYSEFDTVSAKANAWVAFTMINNSLKRKDIVERALIIKLERIQEFHSHRELLEKFNPVKIWGHIIYLAREIISHLINNGYTTQNYGIRRIRMQDFAVFVDVICQIKDWQSEKLAQWWLRETASESLEDNLYFMAFINAMNEGLFWNRTVKFKEILDMIKRLLKQDYGENRIECSNRERQILQSWKPKTFWGWLENQKENLKMQGVEIFIQKDNQGVNTLYAERIDNENVKHEEF